jgi:hypothetical protein
MVFVCCHPRLDPCMAFIMVAALSFSLTVSAQLSRATAYAHHLFVGGAK